MGIYRHNNIRTTEFLNQTASKFQIGRICLICTVYIETNLER